MKLSKRSLLTSTLSCALAASASGASVALLDVATNRGTANGQMFLDVGVTDIDASDTVVSAAPSGATITFGGTGYSLTVDNTGNMFTYGNSSWNTVPGTDQRPLMGDAWLYNQRSSSTAKNFTFSGMTANLAANTTYTLWLMGSYTGGEFSEFGDITYDGNVLGTLSSPAADVNNPGGMAQSINFTTGAVVADDFTFTFKKAAGAGGNAAAIQGIAITVPEPSSSALTMLGVGAIALRRRRS